LDSSPFFIAFVVYPTFFIPFRRVPAAAYNGRKSTTTIHSEA